MIRTVNRKNTGRTTTISISERACDGPNIPPHLKREDRIVIEDGWEWHIGSIPSEKQLVELLAFLEIQLTTIAYETKNFAAGKIVCYNLSKNINDPCDGGFWSIEQLKEMSKGQKLKKFKGFSNGSLVDCYVGIGENIIDIYRPNPNAKDVYKEMVYTERYNYIKNNWCL